MKEKDSQSVRNLRRAHSFKYELVGEGVVIGLLTGFVVSAFRVTLIYAETIRNYVVEFAVGGPVKAAAVFVLFMALALLTAALLRWETEISGSGIPQVEAELHGQRDMKWCRVIFGKFAGCAIAIGGGLALGREGPSIQIGAMVGKGFSKVNHRLLTEERMLVTCGAGAGLAAAFGAPLAGAIFALEELHRNFSIEVLISTMGATVAADFVAATVFGIDPVFDITVVRNVPLNYYWAVILLGIILGFAGIIYNMTIDKMQDAFDIIGIKFSGKFGRMLIAFAISFIFIFVFPMALGSGSSLPNEISGNGITLKVLVSLLVAKFIFSTASFGSGAPGGIFLPMLVLGAIIGGIYSNIISGLFDLGSEYITAFTVLAMAGLFSAIVRAPVTGVILITEMTGDFEELLSLVTVALVAYVVADMFGGDPIYTQLLHRQIRLADKEENKIREDKSKVILKSDVYIGSRMDGRPLSEIGLLPGNLVVTIIRDGEEVIPSGRTKLLGGDVLEILCKNSQIEDIERILEEKCRTLLKDN